MKKWGKLECWNGVYGKAWEHSHAQRTRIPGLHLTRLPDFGVV